MKQKTIDFRELLERLRRAGMETAASLTWSAAGKNLLANYERAVRRVAQPG